MMHLLVDARRDDARYDVLARACERLGASVGGLDAHVDHMDEEGVAVGFLRAGQRTIPRSLQRVAARCRRVRLVLFSEDRLVRARVALQDGRVTVIGETPRTADDAARLLRPFVAQHPAWEVAGSLCGRQTRERLTSTCFLGGFVASVHAAVTAMARGEDAMELAVDAPGGALRDSGRVRLEGRGTRWRVQWPGHWLMWLHSRQRLPNTTRMSLGGDAVELAAQGGDVLAGMVRWPWDAEPESHAPFRDALRAGAPFVLDLLAQSVPHGVDTAAVLLEVR
jgi:hypothetical protein